MKTAYRSLYLLVILVGAVWAFRIYQQSSKAIEPAPISSVLWPALLLVIGLAGYTLAGRVGKGSPGERSSKSNLDRKDG